MLYQKNKLLAVFIFSFLVFITNRIQAQDLSKLSNEQLNGFLKQAQASGMTEEQIEMAALAKGYSESDIAQIKERIAKLKAGNRSTTPTNNKYTSRKQLDNEEADSLGNPKIQDDNLKIRDVNNDFKIDKQDSVILQKRAKIYGADIFQNKKLSFEPNLRLATPRNYILGPDDELSIDITGYAIQHYKLKVSTEGTVQVENLSPVYVNGLSIDKAREVIVNKLRGIFPGLNNGSLSADVTLGSVRSIKVMVIGEVQNPGTYTISSLATAFNALYACGGVSERGTLRDIEVYRDGRVIRKIDVYDFLRRGDQKDNIQLHDQDVIRVPYYETRVELEGEVKAPMIFEVRKGETFKTVLDFAGGFSDSAYTKAVNAVRVTATERRMITINQNEYNTFYPQRGDKFFIGKVSNRFENRVTILGAVLRPGQYELTKNLTLAQLIKKADGLKEDAFKGRVLIKRGRENLEPELVTADLDRILKNEIPDVALNKEDSVLVKSYNELHERRTIIIDGAINKPGAYEYIENATVGDIVALAGGFSDGASAARIEIARRIKNIGEDVKTGKTVAIIPISINRDLTLSNEDSKITLQPFDKLYVRRLPNYEEQKNISITGEVVYPGPYALQDKKERIADLIDKAGGLKDEADLGSARFFRDRKQVGINLKEILRNRNVETNILLNAGDVLDIPRKKETVTISGEVMNPITLAYDSKLKFSDYIDKAGGYTDSAKARKTYVKYASGSLDRTKHFLFVRQYPNAEQGMEIIVPKRKKGHSWNTAETIAIGSGLTTLGTAIILLLNYLKK